MALKAFCIILRGHEYSERVGCRCIATAARVGGLRVEIFPAVGELEAEALMKARGLRWTWTTGGVRYCPKTQLRQHPYPGRLGPRLGCAMSHMLLWELCADRGEPILVLEHDAVFVREWPELEWSGICMVNDPTGATPRGAWWASRMEKRGPGVWSKTRVRDPLERIPDGLAGNSAYVLHPHSARELLALYRAVGVWPNDATMCEQLVPGLQELYPWVTRVEQSESTTAAV